MHFQRNEPRTTEQRLIAEDRHYSGNPEIPLDSNVYKPDNFSLVIPAYNEEERIGNLLLSLNMIKDRFHEIVVVCDGNDRTPDIVRAMSSTFKVIEFSNKLGKGGALIEGFKAATGEVIGYVDADGAIGPNDILRVFESVNKDTPVVIASRWLMGSRIVIRQPLIRVILGRIYHYFTFAFLGICQKDTQCGLKAYRREAIYEVLGRLQITNLSIDTAILYHCKLLKYRVLEIPVTWKEVGGSKFSPMKTSLVMLLTLVGLRLAHNSRSRKVKEKLLELHELVKVI